MSKLEIKMKIEGASRQQILYPFNKSNYTKTVKKKKIKKNQGYLYYKNCKKQTNKQTNKKQQQQQTNKQKPNQNNYIYISFKVGSAPHLRLLCVFFVL